MGIPGVNQPSPKNILVESTIGGQDYPDYSNTTGGNVFNTGAPNINQLWQNTYSFTYTTVTNIAAGGTETLSNIPFALNDIPPLTIPNGVTMYASVILSATTTTAPGLLDQGLNVLVTAQTPTPGGAIGFNGPLFAGGQIWQNFGLITSGKIYNATSAPIAAGQTAVLGVFVNIFYR